MGMIMSMFQKSHRVIILGQNAVGKTTVLNAMIHGYLAPHPIPIPVYGFAVECGVYKQFNLIVFDVPLLNMNIPNAVRSDINFVQWNGMYEPQEAVIFILNATEPLESKESLHRLLTLDSLKGKPFLILANFCDLLQHDPSESIIKDLELEKYGRGREWTLRSVSSAKGDGDFVF
ncbi:ADP-ribosylation like factor [Cavenderia fasciculata]|uniref:ADP-ribosylation like factor n=1 Tax=Cavenderia fasciculata TaxID=261658 RepID=F4QB30_CACFS|nr:ADP-ribosylation like factor [Cavenderia fasciculata]EGG14802.1 ADP-ribosylation like factor [Cavenderia fasciculata]|eukprot:XP_004351318.1 ADP-ribosylation like factor [Cavenderia fasciculata]